MKKPILTFVICCSTLFCFSQTFIKKQILIPLNNINGVPFYKDQESNEIIIDGFEIDNKGNFYFLGGNEPTCLAVFSGNSNCTEKSIMNLLPTSFIYTKID